MSAHEIPSERELERRAQEGSFLETLADDLAGSVGSAFGTAVERDGVTVIPVSKARWGLGGGIGADRLAERMRGGESHPEAAVGAGGGVIVKPIGFIELSGGRSRFRPIRDPERLAWAAIAGGLIGLSVLRSVLGTGRAAGRPRLRMAMRIRRRRRRLFG
jgi:uncharacterized spore protein YtfJ